MKKKTVVVLTIVFLVVMSTHAFASDWDKAGKALTIIEGIRILTGGSVDFIGNLMGINNRDDKICYATYHESNAACRQHYLKRVWVPHMVWKRKYVPRHEEYDPEHGIVIVEGRYVSYQVEEGGHWEYRCSCGKKCGSYSKNHSHRTKHNWWYR